MRHILFVESTRYWDIRHPIGARVDENVCASLADATSMFMYPLGAEEATRPGFLGMLEWAWRIVVEFATRRLPVPPGAFWIDLGSDGNVEIGSRLTEVEELLYVGRIGKWPMSVVS